VVVAIAAAAFAGPIVVAVVAGVAAFTVIGAVRLGHGRSDARAASEAFV